MLLRACVLRQGISRARRSRFSQLDSRIGLPPLRGARWCLLRSCSKLLRIVRHAVPPHRIQDPAARTRRDHAHTGGRGTGGVGAWRRGWSHNRPRRHAVHVGGDGVGRSGGGSLGVRVLRDVGSFHAVMTGIHRTVRRWPARVGALALLAACSSGTRRV